MADSDIGEIDQELLEELYSWVDKIPLTRPKKNIQRDFSDGVLVAEIVHHYCPKLVEIHNYNAVHKAGLKLTNWSLLNRKVFKKLGFEITDDVMHNIVNCKPWGVEHFLLMLRRKIDRHLYEKRRAKPGGTDTMRVSDRPEVDQNMAATANNSSAISDASKGRGRLKHGGSTQDLTRAGYQPSPSPKHHPQQGGSGAPNPFPAPDPRFYKGETVPKLAVEEKEQDILAKEETIQILSAKVRRLEHLLHLKDIRIDDLQGRLDRMEVQLRPTANTKKK